MRVRIEHVTRFDYATPATGSFNEVRLTPRNDERQNLLDFDLRTEPTSRTMSYRDHFDTVVHAFNVWAPHDTLVVTGSSTVVTTSRRRPPEGDEPGGGQEGLDLLDTPDFRDEHAEWLRPSPQAGGGDNLVSFAQHVRGVVRPAGVVDLALGVCREVHSRFTYASGTSYVSSTVDDLLERGTGVCQDFAHLTIATLRDLGVPARYVSGYFYAGDMPPEADAELRVESHAWVEALIPGFGWLEVDPTNDCLADERHVVVAVGRDYADVAPLRGTLRGGGGGYMYVEVTMVMPSNLVPRRTPPTTVTTGEVVAPVDATAVRLTVRPAHVDPAALSGAPAQGPWFNLREAQQQQQQQQQQQ
jgi:transglutaminase-like putative cysteine protease